MREYVSKRWQVGIITTLIFSISLPLILSVFEVSLPLFGISFALIATLTAVFVPSLWIRIILYLTYLPIWLYWSEYLSKPMSWMDFLFRWVGMFYNYAGDDSFYNYRLYVLTFLLPLCIIFIEGQINYHQITVTNLALIGYLLLLNEFNNISVILVVISILVLFLFQRALENKSLNTFKGTLLFASMLATVSVLTYILPKQKTQESIIRLSAPYRSYMSDKGIYRYINERKYWSVSKTGFGENDEELGGPVKDDNTLLFKVTQDTPKYWRVESKDYYTGAGWISSIEETPIIEKSPFSVVDTGFGGNFKNSETISVNYLSNGTFIPVPYGNIKIRQKNDRHTFDYLEESRRVNIDSSPNGQEIEIVVNAGNFGDDELRQVETMMPEIGYTYNQVPNSLPKRVATLAEKLTQDEPTMLDKVRAIEHHLSTSMDYTYSKAATPVVPTNRDYVDYFLFDSHVGYCDNFSTSMVMMLRTLGIPARWAKGFSSGELMKKSDKGDVYGVRNSHAHSWPEVYFEGYGWVPFEPTPSFTQPVTDTTQVSNPENDVTSESTTAEETTSESTTTSSTTQVSTTENQQTTEKTETVSTNKLLNKIKLVSIFILSLFSLILVVAVIRYRWVLNLWLRIYIFKQSFSQVFEVLLKQLDSIYPRRKHQTLKNYTKSFSKLYPDTAALFSKLYLDYEEEIYGKGTTIFTAEDKQLFITFSKKITNLKKV